MVATHTVTVLITDLVGSTEQRAAVGEEQADALRREHDRLLSGVVTSSGGTVVKGLGDGVMASFSGAADALAAAVGIQQAVDRQGRSADLRASVRIGLSAGDVSVEDGDCFGTPVIQAARLCAVAEGGQILASEVVRMLAGSRGGFEFIPVGRLELKGLRDPVACVEVAWTPETVDPAKASTVFVPVPAGLQGLVNPPLAGRAESWQALKAVWAAAASGQRQVVLVAGEPGVGKTRLAAELARFAAEEGSVVLFGGSDEDVEVAFGPFTQALRHLVRYAPDDLIAAHVLAWGGALLSLAPGIGERTEVEPLPSTGDAETDRLRLFDAAVDLLARTADRSAVVLVLDDLHWADTSSLRLLRHLVRSAADCRLLVIGTYRDTDVDRLHPLSSMVADLRRDPNVIRLALTGLDTDGVAEYLVGRAGHDLDDVEPLARLLRDETQGNPFFLGEVIQHLVEAGAFYRADDRWQADEEVLVRVGVPEGVRDVVGRRLSALPEQLSDALRVAAIVGNQFDASVVAAVVAEPLDGLLDMLDVAVRHRLVQPAGRAGRYSFVHALVRQTLTEETSLGRRLRLHQAIAGALEANPDTPLAELAYHRCQSAALGHAGEAVSLAGRAAEQAAAAFAWDEAANWYRRALDADDVAGRQTVRRAELLISLGSAVTASGDLAGGRAHFLEGAEEAQRADRADLLVEAAVGYGGLEAFWVDPSDAVGPALVDDALAAVAPGDSADRVRLLAKQSLWLIEDPDYDTRWAIAMEAVAMARRLDRDDALPIALFAAIDATKCQPIPAQRLELADELLAVARRAGDINGINSALYGAATSYAMLGDLDQLERIAQEDGELAARFRHTFATFESYTIAAGAAFARGHFEQGRMLADRMLEAGEPIRAVADFMYDHYVHLIPAWHDHDWPAYWNARIEMNRRHPAFADPPSIDAAAQAWLDGDVSRCRTHLKEAVAALLRRPPFGRNDRLVWVCRLVMDAGAADLAPLIRPVIAPFAGMAVALPEAVIQVGDHALSQLDRAEGRLDDAVDHLVAASAFARTHGLIHALHSDYDLAEVLSERNRPGDKSRTSEVLDALIDQASTHDLPTLHRKARELQATLD